MSIGRTIIIPAILALGVAGSTVAGSAIAVASGNLHPQAHVQTNAVANPNLYYHA